MNVILLRFSIALEFSLSRERSIRGWMCANTSMNENDDGSTCVILECTYGPIKIIMCILIIPGPNG